MFAAINIYYVTSWHHGTAHIGLKYIIIIEAQYVSTVPNGQFVVFKKHLILSSS
jgi:hypothetical protein